MLEGLPVPCRRAWRDTRGYTLQTLIISGILVLASVAASVVLYRAISATSDTRALSDLSAENSPTRPHGFATEHYLESGTPAAKINWTPPLYTGQAQIAGSPSLLNYHASYHCEDSRGPDPADPADDVSLADVALPESGASEQDLLWSEIDLVGSSDDLLGSTFDTDAAFVVGHCLLRARAYTCPEVTSGSRCGTGIDKNGTEVYGPSSDYRFTLSKAPSRPELIEVTAALDENGNQLLQVSWDPPQYLGSGSLRNLIYRVSWTGRAQGSSQPDAFSQSACTFNNFISIADTGRADLYDLQITPLIITDDAVLAAKLAEAGDSEATADGVLPRTVTCPNPPSVIEPPADSSLELLELIPNAFERPQAPTGLAIEPADSAAELFNAAPMVANGSTEELTGFRLSWNAAANATSYLLSWGRADATTPAEAQETADPEAFLLLEYGAAYNFSLWALNEAGRSQPVEICTTVASQHRQLTPSLAVTPQANQLEVTISYASQARFCGLESFCLDNSCQPPEPEAFKVRVWASNTACTNTNTSFPDQTCTAADYVHCRQAPPGDKPRQLALSFPVTALGNGSPLAAQTDYTVEVIAASSCLVSNGSSPYASFPVVAQAQTLASQPVFSPVRNLAIQRDNLIHWTATWDLPADTTGLISYFVGVEVGSGNFYHFPQPANYHNDYSWTPEPPAPLYLVDCLTLAASMECTLGVRTGYVLSSRLSVNVVAVYEHGFSSDEEATWTT